MVFPVAVAVAMALLASCSEINVTYHEFKSPGLADFGMTLSVVKADMTTSVAMSVGMSLTIMVVRLSLLLISPYEALDSGDDVLAADPELCCLRCGKGFIILTCRCLEDGSSGGGGMRGLIHEEPYASGVILTTLLASSALSMR